MFHDIYCIIKDFYEEREGVYQNLLFIDQENQNFRSAMSCFKINKEEVFIDQISNSDHKVII